MDFEEEPYQQKGTLEEGSEMGKEETKELDEQEETYDKGPTKKFKPNQNII